MSSTTGPNNSKSLLRGDITPRICLMVSNSMLFKYGVVFYRGLDHGIGVGAFVYHVGSKGGLEQDMGQREQQNNFSSCNPLFIKRCLLY